MYAECEVWLTLPRLIRVRFCVLPNQNHDLPPLQTLRVKEVVDPVRHCHNGDDAHNQATGGFMAYHLIVYLRWELHPGIAVL